MIAQRIQRLRLLDPAVYMFLAAAALVGFAIDGGIFSVLFNLYMVRMGYGTETIGLVIAAGQLVFAAASLPAGMIGERWGARRMLSAGLAIMAAGCALLAVADMVPPEVRVGWLIANCVVLYVGLALFFVNGAPYLLTLVGESQRSAIFGAQVGALALAAFVGSLVGGFLPQLLGGLVGALPHEPAAFRVSLLTAAAALVPAAAIVVAARPVEAHAPGGAVSPEAAPHSAAGAVAGLLAVMGLVRLLQVAGLASTSAFFNVYLDTQLQVPTEQIGMITAVGRLLAAPAALVTPLLTARYGNHSTVIWSSAATALAMLPLALVPHWSAAGLSFVGVVGVSSIRYASSLVYFIGLVPPNRRGTLAGLNEMAAGVSFTAMTFGGGYLIALVGYRSLFLVGAALTGLSVLLFALAFRGRRDGRRR